MIDDDELIDIFIEESRDILEAIKQHFAQWISSITHTEHLEPILRDLHTLKGNSRMIGLTNISEFMHLLEQMIQKIQGGELAANESVANELIYSLDYLTNYIEDFAKSKSVPEKDIPIKRVKSMITSSSQVSGAHPVEDSVHKKKERPEETEDKGSKSPAVASEYIRVKTDLLEKFGQLAGQVNIARSQLEQQLKAVFEAVSDMAKEIKLIQEKMKHLQMKTDANMRVYQTSSNEKNYEEFDILEMDRYSSLQQSTRILLDKINQLEHMNLLVMEAIRGGEGLLLEQGRAAKKLEEDITHTRLVSLDFLVPRLERVVTQVATDLGKEVKLNFVKVEGEIDRRVLDRLIPPLEHMIRNAIDHGIEMPEERIKNGKFAYGVITLALFRQSSEIVIELGDDGQGIDIDKIKKKALERNLWDGVTFLSKNEAMQLIFLPGFSTKEQVTEISGHGVGMDVVNTEINKLGGTLRVETKLHQGTRFIIRLPFTLSLSKALVFYVGDKLYAIQLSHLVGVLRLPLDDIRNKLKNPDDKLNYANALYELFYLSEFLEAKTSIEDKKKHNVLPIIFLEAEEQRAAFVVDKLMGSCEVVIKPAGMQLQFVKEICGVSVLGNGQIVLILDAQYLIQLALNRFADNQIGNSTSIVQPKKMMHIKTKVLIVDDSNTVRQVTSRFLRRHQYETMTAKNGIDALQLMADNPPDIVLLDIEMPNMDGYEVLEKMHEDQRYLNIPVIMITSRAGEKHRLRAMKMGAHDYLSKPYREEELLTLLRKYHANPHEKR